MNLNRNVPNDTGAAKRVPAVSAGFIQWFTKYSRRYIRRHFHSLRVLRSNIPSESIIQDHNDNSRSIVVYSNHASWWDPLVCLVVMSHFLPERRIYAPMDAMMLEKYTMFRRLGFFGVEPRSARGALQFVRTAEAILRSEKNLLVITPQGRFADVRERPVHFEAGIGHLASRLHGGIFIPCAVEYVFWEERLPEILLHFGEPVDLKGIQRDLGTGKTLLPDQWTALLEEQLRATQETLSTESKKRNAENFQTILRGGAGQGGVYDWWRSIQAKVSGKQFSKEHGVK